MFDLVIKAVRIGLLALLGAVLYSGIYLWLNGLFDVRIILIGIYSMTIISIIPYTFVNILYNIKNRHRDGRWVIYVALSISLLLTLIVAFMRLVAIDSSIQPIAVQQLRYDGTLALSMALLGLASLLYLGSIIPDVEKIVGGLITALKEEDEEETYEVEIV
ncbi:hypothetical protein [Thermoproteus tenax]|uniref:Uncharacterized protein n=1 Tax=Thermoproteus tenax (strain ATCC 35583 / DSM 2078 / JCM 9277 / NBRC 100435 / Kra 1) TaxID=768679 RepID=G4RL16_THETK|nr:hypothetical protein [Thermoproteus tenax]CCC82261.1 hypothetical protein TTX_1637 [Thermoproteus tenax Kra 1]